MDMSKKRKRLVYRTTGMIHTIRINAPKKVKTYTDAVDGFPRYWQRRGKVVGKTIDHQLPSSHRKCQIYREAVIFT